MTCGSADRDAGIECARSSRIKANGRTELRSLGAKIEVRT